MDSVYINDKFCPIFNQRDFFDLIEANMGQSTAELAEKYCKDVDSEKMYAEMKYNSDLHFYEMELEEHTRAFQDISDELDTLSNCERFSRKKILETIKNIREIISNYF